MNEKNKPVDSPSFWRGRIKDAINVGNIRHSVFRVPEHMWTEVTKHHRKILHDKITAMASVGRTTKVLDAGCGYGRASEWFPDYIDYTGVDLSPDFINLARQMYPDRDFLVGDLTDLPFEDNYFDWSFCISVMIMVTQNLGWSKWEAIQNELLRVSKNVLCLEYGTADTDTESNTYYLIKSHDQI